MFTIYARTTGKVLLTTDDENLARGSLMRGHRVTRSIFGQEVDL
jgi:hypothetical protein